ncbi:hypothetical protein [Parvibaculum sp.]|uniref:hypothetical protein n=1 Tax=Parvibaculum sp. TaxID=2024848 RepID=UPI003BAA2B1F
MKPDVNVVMQGFFGTMLGEIAPHLNAEYSMGNIGVMSMMMFMTAEEYDRAADIRATENKEMRSLFSHASTMVADNALKAKLAAASAEKEGSLRITALNARNASLCSLLIELQSHVEESDAPWARSLEARIWDYLVAATERRKLPLPSFG